MKALTISTYLATLIKETKKTDEKVMGFLRDA